MALMPITGRKPSQRHRPVALPANPLASAKLAGLRYVTDALPGIRRQRAGRGFIYISIDGTPIRDPQERHRIKALGIPPAWMEVWIGPISHGHLQATGRDAKGRKQYRYHTRWREVRDQTKYGQMCAFGEALPLIRHQVEHDLALPGLPRAKVLATVLGPLEMTLVRVGNEEYARANDSFGLTTLRDRHVHIMGATLRFQFHGKSGKEHRLEIHNRRLAKIVQRCQDLPGQGLFQYLDDEGQRRTIDSNDVNEYLQQITGQDFTTKDFRTWAGSVLATEALQACGACESATQARKNVVQAIKTVAMRLGNTPAICRKCYVHPTIIEAYLAGSLIQRLSVLADQERGHSRHRLSPQERIVLVFLQHALAQDANGIRLQTEAIATPAG
jgi:DNA topoisomerase-1